MKKFVFIDESIRTQYTIAAVIVPISKVGDYRQELLRLRPRGARAFHMGNEKRQGRKAALQVVSKLDYIEVMFAGSRLSSQAFARRECLTELLDSLLPGDYQLVLDRTTMERSDREILFRFRKSADFAINFLHADRYQEPGLWGADIFAWAYGTEYYRAPHRKAPVKDARLGAQPPAAS